MSTTTENYNLIIPEGDDLFAPLNVEAPNFRSIDSNMWDNRLAGIQSATELISGSVHAITRETPDAPMFRYTATGAFNNGDTFTVDGISVQAVLPNGVAVEGGAYIEGCEVLGAVVGSKMTLYIGAGSGDADTLEGHPASYFGTAQRTEEVAALAQAANTTANAANSAAQDAIDGVAGIMSSAARVVKVWENPDIRVGNSYSTLTMSNVPSGVKFFIIRMCRTPWQSMTSWQQRYYTDNVVIAAGIADGSLINGTVIAFDAETPANHVFSLCTVNITGNTVSFAGESATPIVIYAVA